MRNRIWCAGSLPKIRAQRSMRPLPVAERWFPKPEILGKTPGMHRFVWNLTWGSSGGPIADEDADLRNPSGPKVVPGIYQVRLTVDGQSQTQPLEVIMDPRSPATPEVLPQQFQLGQQIFAETIQARRALAEISSVQKQIAEAQQSPGSASAELKTALTEAQSSLTEFLPAKRTLKSRATDCRTPTRIWHPLCELSKGAIVLCPLRQSPFIPSRANNSKRALPNGPHSSKRGCQTSTDNCARQISRPSSSLTASRKLNLCPRDELGGAV